jgi:hypothetical protein
VSVAPEEDQETEAKLEQLLRAARHDHDPSAANRAAVERALLQRLGRDATSAAPAASTNASWLPSVNVWVVATTLAVASVATWLQLHRPRMSSPAQLVPSPNQPEASVQPDTSVPEVTQPQPSALPPPTPNDMLSAPTKRRSSATPAGPPRSARPAPAGDSAYRAQASSSEVLADKTSGVIHVTGESSASESFQLADAQPSATAEPRHLKLNAALPERPKMDPPRAFEKSELAFMLQVHAVLGDGNFTQVLELCTEHARRWPHGAFEQEREGVRVLAACALKQRDSEQKARAYFTRFAHSPLTPRIRMTCKLPVQAMSRAD